MIVMTRKFGLTCGVKLDLIKIKNIEMAEVWKRFSLDALFNNT